MGNLIRTNDYRLSAFVGNLDNAQIRKMTPSSYNVTRRHSSDPNDSICERHNGMLWGNKTIGDLLDLYGPHRDVIVDMSNRDDTVIEQMASDTPISCFNLGFFKKWRYLSQQMVPIRLKLDTGAKLTQDELRVVNEYVDMCEKTDDIFSKRKYMYPRANEIK